MKGSSYMSRFSKEKQAKKFKLEELKEKKRKEKQRKLAEKKKKQKEKEQRQKQKELERKKKKEEMSKPWDGKDKPGQLTENDQNSATNKDSLNPKNSDQTNPNNNFPSPETANDLPTEKSGEVQNEGQDDPSNLANPISLSSNPLANIKKPGSSYLDVLGRRNPKTKKENVSKLPELEAFLEIEEDEEELEKVAEEPVQILKKLYVDDLEIIRMGEIQILKDEEKERERQKEKERLEKEKLRKAEEKAVQEKLERERKEKERLAKELRALKEKREREIRERQEKMEQERKEKEKKVIQKEVIVKTITKTIVINKVGSQKTIIKEEEQKVENTEQEKLENSKTQPKSDSIQKILPQKRDIVRVKENPKKLKNLKHDDSSKTQKNLDQNLKKLQNLSRPKTNQKQNSIPLPAQIQEKCEELSQKPKKNLEPNWKQKKLIPKFKRKKEPQETTPKKKPNKSPKPQKIKKLKTLPTEKLPPPENLETQTLPNQKTPETESKKSKMRKMMPQNMRDYQAMIRKSKIINRKRRSGGRDFISRNKKKLTQNQQEIRQSQDSSQKTERKARKNQKKPGANYQSHQPAKSKNPDLAFKSQHRKKRKSENDFEKNKFQKCEIRSKKKSSKKKKKTEPYRQSLPSGKKSVESFLNDLKKDWEAEEESRREAEKWWEDPEVQTEEEVARNRNISELKDIPEMIIREEEEEYTQTDEDSYQPNEELYRTDNFLWRREGQGKISKPAKPRAVSQQKIKKPKQETDSGKPDQDPKPSIKSKNSYYRRAMKKNLVKDFHNMKKKTLQEKKREAVEQRDQDYLEKYYQPQNIGAERIDKEWKEKKEIQEKLEMEREMEEKRRLREIREKEIEEERKEIERKEKEKRERKKRKKKERLEREKREREEKLAREKQEKEEKERKQREEEERKTRLKEKKRANDRKKYLNSFLNNKTPEKAGSDENVIEIHQIGKQDAKDLLKEPTPEKDPISINSLIQEIKEKPEPELKQIETRDKQPNPEFLEMMALELANIKTQIDNEDSQPSQKHLKTENDHELLKNNTTSSKNIEIPSQNTETDIAPTQTFHKKMNIKRVPMSEDEEEVKTEKEIKNNLELKEIYNPIQQLETEFKNTSFNQEEPKETEEPEELEDQNLIDQMEQQLIDMIMDDYTDEIEQQKFAEMESFLQDKERSFISPNPHKPKKKKKNRKPRNLIKPNPKPKKSENKGILERFEEPKTARRNPKKFLKAKSQRLKLKSKKVSRVERVMKRNLWELGDTLKRKGFTNYDTHYNKIQDQADLNPNHHESKWEKSKKKDFVEGNKNVRLARKGFGGIRKRDKFIIGKGMKDFALGKKEDDRNWRTQTTRSKQKSANRSRLEDSKLSQSPKKKSFIDETENQGIRQLDKKILEGLKKKKEHKDKMREKKKLEKKLKKKKDKMQEELERMYRSSYQMRKRENQLTADQDEIEAALAVQMELREPEPSQIGTEQETQEIQDNEENEENLQSEKYSQENERIEQNQAAQPKINFLERNKQKLEELRKKKEQEKKEKEKKPKKIDLWSKIKEERKRELERQQKEKQERGELSQDNNSNTLEEERKRQNYKGRDGQEVQSKISQWWKGAGQPPETPQAQRTQRGRSLRRKSQQQIYRELSSTLNSKSNSRRFIKSSSRKTFNLKTRSHSRPNLVLNHRHNSRSRKNLNITPASRSRRFIDKAEPDVKVVMIEEIRKTGEGLDPGKIQEMLEMAESERPKTPVQTEWKDNFTKNVERPKTQIVVKSMKYSRSMLKTLMEENRKQDLLENNLGLGKVNSEKQFKLKNQFKDFEMENVENEKVSLENEEIGDDENETSEKNEIEDQSSEKDKILDDREIESKKSESTELINETIENKVEKEDLENSGFLESQNKKTESSLLDQFLKSVPGEINQSEHAKSEDKEQENSAQSQSKHTIESSKENEEIIENEESNKNITEEKDEIDQPTPENQETQDQLSQKENNETQSEPELNTNQLESKKPESNQPQSQTESQKSIEPIILGVLFLDEDYGFYGEWDLPTYYRDLTPSELQSEAEKYQKIEAEERALSEDNKSAIAVSVKGADKFVQRQIKHRKKTSKRLDYYPKGGVFVLAKKKREKPKLEDTENAESKTQKKPNEDKISVKKSGKKVLYQPKARTNRNHRNLKDRQSHSRKNSKSGKKNSKTNPKQKETTNQKDPDFKVSKAPALLKFKSRRKKKNATDAHSHSDMQASHSFISDFEPNQHFEQNFQKDTHTQKISQLEVDLNQALQNANKNRKNSFKAPNQERQYDSEGEDFTSVSELHKHHRLSQTLQHDNAVSFGKDAFRKKSGKEVSNKKVRKRRKYDPSGVVSKQKKRRKFLKNKKKKEDKVKQSQVQKELGGKKLVPKIKVEIENQKKKGDIRNELRQNNKKLLKKEKQLKNFADPKTKNLIDQIERSRKSIPHPKPKKNLKALVKVDNLEEPRIRHGNFIPQGKDKKALLENLEKVRNSKPITNSDVEKLRRKIKQEGQLSIDVEGAHAADLLETIRKLSGEPSLSQNVKNQVESFKNFEIIEQTLKSSSREETLREIINSHKKSFSLKTPVKSQMSGKSAEIRKHETKPSDLDEKNQSFVDQIIKSTFDVEKTEPKQTKNLIQSFQTGAQPDHDSLQFADKTPIKPNFTRKVETGIKPETSKAKPEKTTPNPEVKISKTKKAESSNRDSTNLLKEPGITESLPPQNPEINALLEPKKVKLTQLLSSTNNIKGTQAIQSARRLRHWTSEAQIPKQRLLPSREPNKSLRKLELSKESDQKINFRSLARASKTGISSLKMIKSIISHSKEPSKSGSRRRFNIQEKLASASKFKEKQPKKSSKNQIKQSKNQKEAKNKTNPKPKKKIKKTESVTQGLSNKKKSQMARSNTYKAPFQPFRPGQTIDISELSRLQGLKNLETKDPVKPKKQKKQVKKADSKKRGQKTQRSSRSNREKNQLGRSLGPLEFGRTRDSSKGKGEKWSRKKAGKRFKPKSKRGKYDSSIGFGSKRTKKK